jgi:chromosome segregation protein
LYLSKLEILGFKSFANKTVINYNSGVTSIVGPNGCGKTNIVDAIRWCLGEQRSGTLRSDKMENVIFNGSMTKKPMGMAEVSLTIQNTKGILPTEYSEVTITRRIFRSGESEYLLNKNLCRLKDITNLFLDTGIGANAYSVIELKMVETILSSKAEERRTLFEEAAGVNKYKLRRRLALRKLDEVKSDLTRVNDIVSEVQKKVNSLERQAKKAEKYNKVSTGLKEIEIDLAEREFASFNIRKNEAKQKKEEYSSRRIEIDSGLAEINEKVKNIRSTLREVEFQLKSKGAEVNTMTEKIYNSKKNISVSEERINSLQQNIERYNQEKNELKTQLSESYAALEHFKINLDELIKLYDEKIIEKQEKNVNLATDKAGLEEKRANLKLQSEKQFEDFKEITNQENQLSNIEKQIEAKNSEISKLQNKIQNLTNNIAKTIGFIEELNNEKDDSSSKLREGEQILLSKQKEKEGLEKQLNFLKEKELQLRSDLNTLKEKISFIQNLINNLEGFSKGAKALVEDDSWTTNEKALSAHIGSTSNKFKYAIEAALKNNLNDILVKTFDDLKKGIEYLKNNERGKASFFVVSQNGKEKGFIERLHEYSLNKKAIKIEREGAFYGWAKDHVQTEAAWKGFFDKILYRTAIVDKLDTALKLSKSYPQFNFTTLDGDYVDADGTVEAGSVIKLDESLFGRRQYLEDLKNEFPAKERQIEDIKKEIEAAEGQLNEIDLKNLSEENKLISNDISNLEKQIAQFEFENKKAKDESERINKEIHDLVHEINSLEREKDKLTEAINIQKEKKQFSENLLRNLEEEFNAEEKEYNSLVEYHNNLNLEIERLQGDKKNLENSIRSSNENIENTKKLIEKRDFDIASSTKEKEDLQERISKNNEELTKLETEKTVLIEQEKEIDENYKSLQNQINDLENKQNEFRGQRDEISELIHQADMSVSELNLKTANLLENIKENYSITLETKSFDDLDTFDFEGKTQEVHKLKEQIKSLGAINLLAYSEFEEEKERLNFLTKQKDDLIESEKDIIKTIEEINNTAQSKFVGTFDKIRSHFIEIFRNLFNPGDEADLRLEEGTDPLEAKIEIIAKPKGKRPTSIELLSGGEKTLTAIALLFAIYLVKPSPFCILDEIDAPLDDANIDRFTKILEEFSKNTQFIVVTHNKRTMEAANTLYGVTMQEEGISKLVSVRFSEDLALIPS